MKHDPVQRLKLAFAFAAVYLVWGSSYLAIRVGVAELPPALFAGVRFICAGILITVYARAMGQPFPTATGEWKTIVVVALLLLVGANGLVVWGERWVPSNQAALIVATTALWLAGFGTLGPHGQALSARTRIGLVTGFAGVALLLVPHDGLRFDYLAGQFAILLASLSWAMGSIYGKRQHPTTAPLMSAGMQSLVAGLILSAIGLALGEPRQWHWSKEGILALAYLIVFGSCVGYVAFVWLLHAVSPAALGTYAYVNPAVAVVLGWLILGETLTAMQLAGMGIILIGVVFVSTLSTRDDSTQAPGYAAPSALAGSAAARRDSS